MTVSKVKEGQPKLPSGPHSVTEGMHFAETFLTKLMGQYDPEDLCSQILQWRWHLNTTFTGPSCAEVAATSIAAHCK